MEILPTNPRDHRGWVAKSQGSPANNSHVLPVPIDSIKYPVSCRISPTARLLIKRCPCLRRATEKHHGRIHLTPKAKRITWKGRSRNQDHHHKGQGRWSETTTACANKHVGNKPCHLAHSTYASAYNPLFHILFNHQHLWHSYPRPLLVKHINIFVATTVHRRQAYAANVRVYPSAPGRPAPLRRTGGTQSKLLRNSSN